MEKIHFTTKVLGPAAAYKLMKGKISQTLRAGSASIAEAILNGQVSTGDQLEITLDGIKAGRAELISMDAVTWGNLNTDDARRGGFNDLGEMEAVLRRAGYRFKPLNEYELFRIKFTWLEEADV